MRADNEWHPAVLAKLKDGRFAINETLKEGQDEHGENLTGEYQQVRWNWNYGQPKIDFGDSIGSIVDLDIQQL